MSELPNEGDYIRCYDDGTYEVIKIVNILRNPDYTLYFWTDGAITWKEDRDFL